MKYVILVLLYLVAFIVLHLIASEGNRKFDHNEKPYSVYVLDKRSIKSNLVSFIIGSVIGNLFYLAFLR